MPWGQAAQTSEIYLLRKDLNFCTVVEIVPAFELWFYQVSNIRFFFLRLLWILFYNSVTTNISVGYRSILLNALRKNMQETATFVPVLNTDNWHVWIIITLPLLSSLLLFKFILISSIDKFLRRQNLCGRRYYQNFPVKTVWK